MATAASWSPAPGAGFPVATGTDVAAPERPALPGEAFEVLAELLLHCCPGRAEGASGENPDQDARPQWLPEVRPEEEQKQALEAPSANFALPMPLMTVATPGSVPMPVRFQLGLTTQPGCEATAGAIPVVDEAKQKESTPEEIVSLAQGVPGQPSQPGDSTLAGGSLKSDEVPDAVASGIHPAAIASAGLPTAKEDLDAGPVRAIGACSPEKTKPTVPGPSPARHGGRLPNGVNELGNAPHDTPHMSPDWTAWNGRSAAGKRLNDGEGPEAELLHFRVAVSPHSGSSHPFPTAAENDVLMHHGAPGEEPPAADSHEVSTSNPAEGSRTRPAGDEEAGKTFAAALQPEDRDMPADSHRGFGPGNEPHPQGQVSAGGSMPGPRATGAPDAAVLRKAPEAPAAPSPVEIPQQPSESGSRRLVLQVDGREGQRVDIRLVQTPGILHVRLSSLEAGLVERLRSEMHLLEISLEAAGWRTEVGVVAESDPAPLSAPEPRSPRTGQSAAGLESAPDSGTHSGAHSTADGRQGGAARHAAELQEELIDLSAIRRLVRGGQR